jgi:hypothetical protein
VHKALNLRGGNKVKTNLVVVVVVPGFTYQYRGENHFSLILSKIRNSSRFPVQNLIFEIWQKKSYGFSDLLISFFWFIDLFWLFLFKIQNLNENKK